MFRPLSPHGLLGLLLSMTACFTSSQLPSDEGASEEGRSDESVMAGDVSIVGGRGTVRDVPSRRDGGRHDSGLPPDLIDPWADAAAEGGLWGDEAGTSDASDGTVDAEGGTAHDAGVSDQAPLADGGVPGDAAVPPVHAGEGDAATAQDAGPAATDGGAPAEPFEDGGAPAPDAAEPDAAEPAADAAEPDAPEPDLDAGAVEPDPSAGPCTAALPTGLCIRSDVGDYAGRGRAITMSGSEVTLQGSGPSLLVEASNGSDRVRVELVAPDQQRLGVGVYPRAMRAPFMDAGWAGLAVSVNGSSCGDVEGSFEITELWSDPDLGLVRLAATFEQRCEGYAQGLRGAINFRARGTSDTPLTSVQTIALPDTISRLAYDPDAHVAYGIDRLQRSLCRVDLDSEEVSCVDVVQRPDDLCVDPARGRLFVVNKGSSIITEHELTDLSLVRELTWNPVDSSSSETQFKIYCTPERLFVVDGAWQPGLWTVDGLDTEQPVVTKQTSLVSGVGGLVTNEDSTELYTWKQVGWGAGSLSTSVTRFTLPDLLRLDETDDSYSEGFVRDPIDAPVLLDEARGLIFAKNRVFDRANLLRTVYTLSGGGDSWSASRENAYALDSARGLFATKNYVYDIDTFRVVAMTLAPNASQLFFDRDGRLRFFSRGALLTQDITR